jgi:hypothetical protein
MSTEFFCYKDTKRSLLMSLIFHIGSLKQKVDNTYNFYLFDTFTLKSIDEVITVSFSMIICVIKSLCKCFYLLCFNYLSTILSSPSPFPTNIYEC